MKNKKKLIILSIVAILLIVVLTQASYAYFTTPGSTGSEETISSGTMALSFSDGPQINATNLAPGDYIEKTFSVTNTGTLATTYDVYLSEVLNTFVQKSDLVYELTSNDGGYNTSSEVVVPNQEAKIVDTYSIGVGATHHYTLKITYKLTNQIQNDNMGRGFTAKISINEYTTNNSEHLLKLLDTSGNLVDKQMISSGITDYYYNLANTSLTGITNIYCNNGGIPTISNNQLKVSDITVETECKMSSDVVDTINNKLTTSKTGVVMTNNQNNITKMSVTEGKEVVFDFNGKSLNSVGVNDTSTTWDENDVVFRFSGTLTLNDSVGTGGAYTGKGQSAIASNPDGTLYINGGNYTGKNSLYVPSSNAYVEINGGTFETKNNANISLAGSDNRIVVNNANITQSSSGAAAFNEGCSGSCTLDINGGYYDLSENAWILATGSTNVGEVNINGGTFKHNLVQIIGIRGGTVNINNGDFYVKNSNFVHKVTPYTGVLNIYGGNFETESSNSLIYNNSNLGEINIYNGTFKTDGYAVNNNSTGVINVRGGTYESNNPSIFNTTTGIINVSSGKYESNNTTIVNNGSGTINITGGDFKSKASYVVHNKSDGTININGSEATFDNKNNYVSGIYMHNDDTSAQMYLIQNNGIMNITNGTYRSKAIAIVNQSGVTNIYGGDYYIHGGSGENLQYNSAAIIQIKPHSGTINIYGGTFESTTGYGIRRNGPGTINVYDVTIKTYEYNAVSSNCDECNEGGINICKMTLLNNTTVSTGNRYLYYHTNAFGSVTPTFVGNTANIQIDDSVCDY